MKTLIHAAAILLAVTLLTAAADENADKPETKDVKIKAVTLKVPGDWKQKKASNNLRLAEFEIPPAKEDGPSEIVVYSFGGGGGGIQANIDRWIKQFEADGREVKVVQGKSPQGPYVVVDIQGTYNMPVGPPIQRQTKAVPESRMLAVILGIEGQGNYFLKFTGGQQTVKGQLEKFRSSFGADAESEKPLEL